MQLKAIVSKLKILIKKLHREIKLPQIKGGLRKQGVNYAELVCSDQLLWILFYAQLMDEVSIVEILCQLL